jgi:quinol-cytochrome oxidoreductase complex cytochrome b subunit
MMLPGLISIAFYRRRPTTGQITLGFIFTVVVSGLLGYIQDYGTSRVWENTILAIVLGLVLYLAILAYLWLCYFPKHEAPRPVSGLPPSTPPP